MSEAHAWKKTHKVLLLLYLAGSPTDLDRNIKSLSKAQHCIAYYADLTGRICSLLHCEICTAAQRCALCVACNNQPSCWSHWSCDVAQPASHDEGMQPGLLHAVTDISGTGTRCVLPLGLTDNATNGLGSAAGIFILRGYKLQNSPISRPK